VRLTLIITLLISLSAAADISRLGWMSGCWAYDGAEPGSGEYWMPPVGGTMFAVSRSIRDSRTVAFEYLRIEESGDGSLALFASPSGQSPARFDMVSLTNNEVVFENSEHDFPQRIIYRLAQDSRLIGRIEGQSNGQLKSIEFPMSKINCDSLG
jgi:hypothetical protein